MNDDDDCDSGTYYTNAFLASTQQNLDMASSQQHTGGGYLALAPNLPTIPEASPTRKLVHQRSEPVSRTKCVERVECMQKLRYSV